MKNILILLLAIVICGCGAIQISPEAETVLIKSAARTLGYKTAQEFPDEKVMAIAFIDVLIASEDATIDAILDEGVRYLIKRYAKEPLLRASLMDLKGMVKIETGEYDIGKVKIAAAAFREGMEL